MKVMQYAFLFITASMMTVNSMEIAVKEENKSTINSAEIVALANKIVEGAGEIDACMVQIPGSVLVTRFNIVVAIASIGNDTILKKLLDRNPKNNIDEALRYAVMNGHTSCVASLLEYSGLSSFNIKFQQKILDLTIKYQHGDILEILLKKGINPNGSTKRNYQLLLVGNRPLEKVVESESHNKEFLEKATRLLLRYGAATSYKYYGPATSYKKTTIISIAHRAEKAGNTNLVHIIREYEGIRKK